MHPILFEIPLFGGITIYTYGVLTALGFLSGMMWVSHEAKRVGADPDRALDLVFYIIVASILGARATYVLVSDSSQFFSDPLSFFRIWEGGLVYYGGFIGALAMTVWYTHRHHLSFLLYADILAAALPLGHAIGRLGCIMAGCCYGRPVAHEHWWTLTFPGHIDSFAPPGVPLYPTQIMESLGNLLIFATLFVMARRKQFTGQVFAVYLILYAVMRSVIEIYRGDHIRGFLIDGILSTSQAISIVVVLIGIGIWIRGRRRGS